MAYNGRRGPNVSEYIANLNAIPSAQDIQAADAEFSIDDDLAMFTNTQFFDFDMGHDTDLSASNFVVDAAIAPSVAAEDVKLKSFELIDDSTFNFPHGFSTYTQTPFSEALPSIQTHQPAYAASSTSDSPTSAIPQSATRTKRKADSISAGSPSKDIEDASRLAAEEDKRRRNTAASARFRVKKKQREQALEKSAKEMSDKVAALEGRINQLETENKWLKNLITEKNESNEDIAALWKKYSSEKESAERERKDVSKIGSVKLE